MMYTFVLLDICLNVSLMCKYLSVIMKTIILAVDLFLLNLSVQSGMRIKETSYSEDAICGKMIVFCLFHCILTFYMINLGFCNPMYLLVT